MNDTLTDWSNAPCLDEPEAGSQRALELRHAMTCKIERVLTPVGFVVFRVTGRIDCASAEVLQELTENETAKGRLALDLTEVTVVSLKPSGRLPLRKPTESNFETARPTYANGFPECGNVDCPSEPIELKETPLRIAIIISG